MRIYDPLLYPFALIYDGITRFRNRLFDIGSKRSIAFEIPTIVVGNLSLGGTGKTPMVEFLIDTLKKEYRIATLSRGYGRKTSGYLMADNTVSASELGDEPFQIYQKYGDEVAVFVGEERVLAIPQILVDHPETNLILLDDAFQHRYIKADMYILLTTFQKPFFKDRILPLGTLREDPRGAKRADLIVVTKCPKELSGETKKEYRERIAFYSGENCPLVFGRIKYGEPYSVVGNKRAIPGGKAIVLTGIADNKVFIEEIEGKYEVVERLTFPDHHRYSEKNMLQILSAFEKYKKEMPFILTTEKDAVKLKEEKLIKYLKEIPIFALPMKTEFETRDKDLILKIIAKAIERKSNPK